MFKILIRRVQVSQHFSLYNTGTLNTANIAKKKAKQLEKEAKLAAKAVKNAATAAVGSGEKKVKAEKEKKEEEAPFVNTTPKGEKKGAHTYCYTANQR